MDWVPGQGPEALVAFVEREVDRERTASTSPGTPWFDLEEWLEAFDYVEWQSGPDRPAVLMVECGEQAALVGYRPELELGIVLCDLTDPSLCDAFSGLLDSLDATMPEETFQRILGGRRIDVHAGCPDWLPGGLELREIRSSGSGG